MSPDVFICHSSKDKSFADKLVKELEDMDIQCWIAPRNIQPGKKWAGEIMRALDHSRTLLFILSKSSNESDQVLTELETAKDERIPIIPVIIEAVELTYDVRYFIRSHQWIDAQDVPFDAVVDNVVSSLRSYIPDTDNGGNSVPGKVQAQEAHEESTTGVSEAPAKQAPPPPEVVPGALQHPYFMVHHGSTPISSLENIPAIEQILTHGRPLVIVSNKLDGNALDYLTPRDYKGITVQVVKAPGFGDRQKELLQDVAIVTGASFLDEDMWLLPENADSSALGESEAIKINYELDQPTRDQQGEFSASYAASLTSILNGKGEAENIEERIAQLERFKGMTSSDYDREKIAIRINNFNVHPGGYTFEFVE